MCMMCSLLAVIVKHSISVKYLILSVVVLPVKKDALLSIRYLNWCYQRI